MIDCNSTKKEYNRFPLRHLKRSSHTCIDIIWPHSTTIGEKPVYYTKRQTTCHYCNAHERHIIHAGENLVCALCASVQKNELLYDTPLEKIKSSMTGTIVKKHLYDRKVYFLEHLRCLRGEKQSMISTRDYERIENECKSISNDEWKNADNNIIVPILKKLKLTKYTSSRSWLSYKLSKRQFVQTKVLKRDQDRLCMLFMQIQQVYPEVRDMVDPKRKIFMHYGYLLHALTMIVGNHHICKGVKIPQNSKSLTVNGRLWRALCMKLGWKWFSVI